MLQSFLEGSSVLGRGGGGGVEGIPWPPRSSDLAILVFSFGVRLSTRSGKVPPAQQPANILQLQAAIVRECHYVTQALIHNAFNEIVG